MQTKPTGPLFTALVEKAKTMDSFARVTSYREVFDNLITIVPTDDVQMLPVFLENWQYFMRLPISTEELGEREPSAGCAIYLAVCDSIMDELFGDDEWIGEVYS